jgi:hypothetical protein
MLWRIHLLTLNLLQWLVEHLYDLYCWVGTLPIDYPGDVPQDPPAEFDPAAGCPFYDTDQTAVAHVKHVCGHMQDHRYYVDDDNAGADVAEWEAVLCSKCQNELDERIVAQMEAERDVELALEKEPSQGMPTDAMIAEMAEEQAEQAGDKARDAAQFPEPLI